MNSLPLGLPTTGVLESELRSPVAPTPRALSSKDFKTLFVSFSNWKENLKIKVEKRLKKNNDLNERFNELSGKV